MLVDVVIVGCGVIGLATAERLVARNLSVVVVDGAGVAGRVSGVSGGLVRAHDEHVPDLAAEGLDIYRRRGWSGRWPEIRRHGSLVLFDAADRAAAATARLAAAGHRAELLSAKEMHAKFDGLSVPAGFVGLYEPLAGWLPARELTAAMFADASPGMTLLSPVHATAPRWCCWPLVSAARRWPEPSAWICRCEPAR
jgi:glycine/D-amino acid oxidase-like deaminating enzyme